MVNTEKSALLLNKRVLITRPEELSGTFGEQLNACGAEVIYFPAIRILPPEDFSPLDQAIQNIHQYHWLIFTSVNGVKYFFERYRKFHKNTSQPGLSIAAIGPSTSEAVNKQGWKTDLIPEEFVAEALADTFSNVENKKFLLPRADIARADLRNILREKGAIVDEVTAYRTVQHERTSAETENLLNPVPDILTFTSSSTVVNFHKATKHWHDHLTNSLVCCIGPVTAQTARELGYRVDTIAQSYTIPGMIKALCEYYEHVH